MTVTVTWPKPKRKSLETASEVLEWLASGRQDPDMRKDIDATRSLIDQLLEVGW